MTRYHRGEQSDSWDTYTDEQFEAIIDRICRATRMGNPVKFAAMYGGVDTKTVQEWCYRGAKEKTQRMNPEYVPDESEQRYVDFLERYETAQSEAAMWYQGQVRIAAEGIPAESHYVVGADGKKHRVVDKYARYPNWTAAAWWLERRHPEEFGKRDYMTVESSQKIQAEVQLDWGDPLPPKKKSEPASP